MRVVLYVFCMGAILFLDGCSTMHSLGDKGNCKATVEFECNCDCDKDGIFKKVLDSTN